MKSKYVMSAIIGIPLLFAVLFPFGTLLPMAQADPADFEGEDFGVFVENLFSKTVKGWNDLDNYGKTMVLMAYAMFVTVLLLPIIIPAVTASETVVGEKERKTIEAILASPMTESEIVTAKILSSLLPSFLGTAIAAIGYMGITDYILWKYIGIILFPDFLSIVFIFIFGPLFSTISVELMIMVSTKVKSVRDSYQIGSLIVLPLILLIAAEMFSFFFASYATLFGGVGGMIVLILILFKLATAIFDREKVITKMV
jgi:ABC-type transport system involved in multi-copper enzyme maturation permease subunit